MTESRRDEQKLWLILFQISSVRARLNLLATQQWLFTTLAFVIGGAALVLLAAARLGPFGFLGAAAIILIVVAGGIVAAARRGWSRRIDPPRAARLADQRAELKGRLATVLALAESPHHGQLWPFLVEDTYSLREDYEPRRIEPRLVSRSIFALLAALILAALAAPNLNRGRGGGGQSASGGGPGGGPSREVTADLDHLDIQPADPALQPNAQIYADPETLRRLQQKLASGSSKGKAQGLGGLMNRARRFADAFQHKLTGRNPDAGAPLRLRLTDRNPGAVSRRKGADHPQKMAKNSSGAASHGASGGAPGGTPSAHDANHPGAPPTVSMPGAQADQMAKNNSTGAPTAGANSNQPGANGNANPPEQDAANDSGGGASHGVGADPEHLFGPPMRQPLGSDSFKIAIDAEPSDEASVSGSPAYVPPKVRVPLNPRQLPDEPIARATVPAGDQMTIKRVFDR